MTLLFGRPFLGVFFLLLVFAMWLMGAMAGGWAQDAAPPTTSPVAPAAGVSVQALPIDLPAVLELVVSQNLQVAQSQAGVTIQRGLVNQQLTTFLPDVQATYNQSRLEGGTQVFGGQVFTVTRKTVQPQVSVAWTVYPGGKTIFDTLAAYRRRSASEIQVKETLQQQLSGAAQEYYRLLAAHTQREVVAEGIRQAQAQTDAAEARYRAGTATKYDWMRSKTLLADQQRQLVEAESAIATSEQSLLNRLNLEPTVRLAPTDIPQAPPQILPRSLFPNDTPVADLIDRARANHPGLQRLDKELQALGFDRKSIISEVVPSVTVRAYLNGTGPEWDQLVRSEFRGVVVQADVLRGLGLRLPARLQSNRGEITQRLLARQALARTLETQVTTAYLNSRNYRQAIEAADIEVASAEEGLRVATGRTAAGYGTTLEVVDAQATLVSARAKRAQAIFNYNQAQIQLMEAIGLASPLTLVKGL